MSGGKKPKVAQMKKRPSLWMNSVFGLPRIVLPSGETEAFIGGATIQRWDKWPKDDEYILRSLGTGSSYRNIFTYARKNWEFISWL